MEINPVDVQRHLKGARYPATGKQLAATAEGNNAPRDLVRRPGDLVDEEFSGPDTVMAALKRS